MRILQATTIVRYGAGIEFTDLCCELARRGHEVHAVSTTHPEFPEWTHLRERLLENGVTTHRAELFKRDSISLWSSTQVIAELLESRPFDAIHAHAGTPAFALWMAQIKTGISIPKFAGSLHGFGSHTRPEWMDWMDRFAWGKCDFISTDSVACMQIARSKGIEPTKGIYPAARFEPKPVSYNKEEQAVADTLRSKFVIACVSEVIPGKGQLDLAIAARKLARDRQQEVACLLVGATTDSEYLSRIEAIAASEPFLSIIAIGQKSRTRPYLEMADASVFPTYAEGLGLGIIESIETETPTYFSFLPDSTIDIARELGLEPERYTFAPGDSEEIARRLEEALSNPIPLAERERSASKAREIFSVRNFVDGFERYFQASQEL